MGNTMGKEFRVEQSEGNVLGEKKNQKTQHQQTNKTTKETMHIDNVSMSNLVQ